MTDVRTVFEEDLATQLAQHPELAKEVDAVLQIEITGEGGGTWTIDLSKEHAPPKVIPGEHSKPKVRFRIAHDDFIDLMSGKQRWTDAFVRGKIDVKGNLLTAMKLRKLFAAYSSDSD